MKRKFSLLLMVVCTLFVVSCGKDDDDNGNGNGTDNQVVPNLITGEWFLHPSEEAPVDPDAPEAPDGLPSMHIKDLYVYAPLILDWNTEESFFIGGTTEWNGTIVSLMGTMALGPMVMESLSAAKFNENGTISATIIAEDGSSSVVEQDYVTYKIVSKSELLLFVNIKAIGQRSGMEDFGALITLITPYLENGFPVNYETKGNVLTFSLNKDFILPIVKAIVPIVAAIDITTVTDPTLKALLPMIQDIFTETVVDSTTIFDLLMSFKNTAPVVPAL